MVTEQQPWDPLAGENTVAAFRGGQLTLTNRRVRYRGRGLARHASAAIRIEDITGLGVVRRHGRWRLLAVPVVVFVSFFALAWLSEKPEPIMMGALLAFLLLPLPLFYPGHHATVASPGFVIHAPVPVRHVEEAREFLEQVEVARRTAEGAEAQDTTAYAPTTSPFAR